MTSPLVILNPDILNRSIQSINMALQRFTTTITVQTIPSPPPQQQPASNFISQLPEINPQHDETCPICLEPFNSTADPEPALRLPCSHVLGRNCIARWLETNDNCPLCRCVFLDLRRESSTPSSSSSSNRAEQTRAAALEEFREIRRQMALVQSELDHLERVTVRMGFARRREVREVERANERVQARLGELVVRFPDLVGVFGDQIR